jgi:hypothetical protein
VEKAGMAALEDDEIYDDEVAEICWRIKVPIYYLYD